MKYNNNKTVKFRGGEEPIQPAIQPEIQPPITIGEPTNIQSGEQSQPSDMDQQQPPSEMGPSEMDQQQEQEDEQPKEDKPIIPVEPLLPPSSEEESEEIAEFRKKMEDPTNKRDYFYINTNISTELNKDKRYKREGVLHFTDSTSIKSNTTIGSLVGQTSLENVTYDKLRNTALKKVDILLGENRRCYNTHIEFERNTDTVFIHIYGTLYVKKSL